MGKWRLTVPEMVNFDITTQKDRGTPLTELWKIMEQAFFDGRTHVISTGPWLQQLCNKLPEGKIDMDREQVKIQGTWYTLIVFSLLSMFTYIKKLANITRPTVQSRAPKR